jgi:large subunit ribosomal protein L6
VSRIGKKPIPLPKGVEVKVNGDTVSVKGPLGALSRTLVEAKCKVEGDNVLVLEDEKSLHPGAMHGLMRTLVANMVNGVSQGYAKTLVITGTGYKAEAGTGGVMLNLGYSKPVDFKLPADVTAEVTDKGTKVTLKSINRESLGDTAAKIRALRPVEPYKGKGVAYSDEKIRRKVGKAGAK